MKWNNRQFLESATKNDGVSRVAFKYIHHLTVDGKSVLASSDGYRMHIVWANPDGSELRAGDGFTEQQVDSMRGTYTRLIADMRKRFAEHNPEFVVTLPIEILRSALLDAGGLLNKDTNGFVLFEPNGFIHLIEQDRWEEAYVLAQKWRKVEGKYKVVASPFYIHVNLNYLFDALTPYEDRQAITITKPGIKNSPYGIGHWGRYYTFLMPLNTEFRGLPTRLRNYLNTGEIK